MAPILSTVSQRSAGPSGRVVKGVVFGRSPAEFGFESRPGGRGHGCLSVVSTDYLVCCECCVLSERGLCDELITRPQESNRLWCVVCDLETS